MNLGIFLSPGESFKLMSQIGQDVRFKNLYLKEYLKEFERIYIFSYEDEKSNLPKNIYLIPNKTKLHRLIYAFLLPIFQFSLIKKCDVVRGFGLASSISSFLLPKPFIFNWAYNYIDFVKVDRKYLYIPLYFILERLAFFRANKVFIAVKNKKISNEKFLYLPNGVNMKRKKSITSKKINLIYLGRFERQKNLFFLLDAISYLPEGYREVTFVGSGSEKKSLINYAQKKLIKLTIIDPLSNDKVMRLLGQYRIFLMTSFAEGSPKVLLEAMSLGLVPVVTRFETARDIVQNNVDGYIVNFNQKKYADKILELINNKNRYNEMSKKAISKIANNFDQDELIKREIRILKQYAQ